jgi:hypothetical protein
VASAIISNAGLIAQMGRLLSGPLFVRLFKNNVDVTEASAVADFEKCTFPDYADMDVSGVFSTPTIDGVGRAAARATNLTWTRGAGGVPESVYGWLLLSGVTPFKYEAGRKFDSPIILDASGQTVIVSLLIYLFRG